MLLTLKGKEERQTGRSIAATPTHFRVSPSGQVKMNGAAQLAMTNAFPEAFATQRSSTNDEKQRKSRGNKLVCWFRRRLRSRGTEGGRESPSHDAEP